MTVGERNGTPTQAQTSVVKFSKHNKVENLKFYPVMPWDSR